MWLLLYFAIPHRTILIICLSRRWNSFLYHSKKVVKTCSKTHFPRPQVHLRGSAHRPGFGTPNSCWGWKNFLCVFLEILVIWSKFGGILKGFEGCWRIWDGENKQTSRFRIFASAGDIFEKFKNAILLKMAKQPNPRRDFFDFVEILSIWGFFHFWILQKCQKIEKLGFRV